METREYADVVISPFALNARQSKREIACLQQHHDFRPVAPPARRFSLRLSTSPRGVSQADFFCGKLNGITFPYSSGRIHFVAFFLKLLGTKNSMIIAINHPTLVKTRRRRKSSHFDKSLQMRIVALIDN